jgi:hypothetical protein
MLEGNGLTQGLGIFQTQCGQSVQEVGSSVSTSNVRGENVACPGAGFGSCFWRMGQTRDLALFALPFFPFPGTEVVAVEFGFSLCPRLLAPAAFLEADLWVEVPGFLPSPALRWVSRWGSAGRTPIRR